MSWREITGYRYLYRVSDMGEFQRQHSDGVWHDIKATSDGKRMKVHVTTAEGVRTTHSLARLAYTAFHGPIPAGHKVTHKNGLKSDCTIYNLKAVPPHVGISPPGNRRPVLKVDRSGNVIAVYRSVVEAAAENHISVAAMGKRCLGKVKDPYRLDGYNYIYEERKRRKKRA